MPPQLTYPGVYIQELPSEVNTITGVATSIAAFVGWNAQGPSNQAVMVQSWLDFARQYGGLDSRTLLGYAVSQFFNNGGQQAYIVRLQSADAVAASVTLNGAFTFTAKNPGGWGNFLAIGAAANTIGDPNRFSINVWLAQPDGTLSVVESFNNLSLTTTDSQYVLTVINSDSNYVTLTLIGTPSAVPSSTMPPSPALTPPLVPPLAPPFLSNGFDGTPFGPTDTAFITALNLNPSTPPITSGIHLLDNVNPMFNLLCVPGFFDATNGTTSTLQGYCKTQRAFHIIDPPQDVQSPAGMQSQISGINGVNSDHSAIYYPWINVADPLTNFRIKPYPPCGFVAGIYASTDADRGVWKAPAGINAGLTGASSLVYVMTDAESGSLNQIGINALRFFLNYGNVIWGARTLQGSDQVGSQWKYIPIRRLALFIESSLYIGTQWVVFEPNDEPLWAKIRLDIGVFMQGLFLQGAFEGSTPQQAYFVKCDSENNPQANIDLGIVTITVGFAPLYPAEFVVIQIQQMAGQLQT